MGEIARAAADPDLRAGLVPFMQPRPSAHALRQGAGGEDMVLAGKRRVGVPIHLCHGRDASNREPSVHVSI